MEVAKRAIVVAIFTAQAAGEPMRSREAVEVVPGLGIPGDRYATRRGHWSDPRWKDQELTFVESELAGELGLALPALRRNIVTSGVDLLDLVGCEFVVGSARLAGARPCAPCRYIERLNERPGLLAALVNRGGLRTSVLSAGTIRVGDELMITGVLEDAAAPVG